MKQSLYKLCLLSLIVVSGCGKDPEPVNIPIVAGENNTNSFYFTEVQPDATVVYYQHCGFLNGTQICGMKDGEYKADLDKDGKTDITLSSSIIGYSAGMGSVSTFAMVAPGFAISTQPVKDGQNISGSLEWITPIHDWTGATPITLSFKKINSGFDGEENNWQEKAYLAIKKTSNRDTRYGWIEIKIDNFDKITVYRYTLQK